jgi:hypothetical protein
MGVFNTVIGSYKTTCCKNSQSGWQSKMAKIKSSFGRIYFVEPLMQKVYVKDLYDGAMHTTCEKCNRFIEYNIKNGKLADWTDL